MSNNFWNWAPSPLELKLKDARANSDRANMEGYIPYEADPKHYEETPAVHAQEMMAGYVPQYAGYMLPNGPAQVPSDEIQGGVRVPQDARQDIGKGWIYAQQQEKEQALRDEYSRNEQRIAEIEQELRTISNDERKSLDDLDMALAENRSSIGDIGNAQMHIGRMDQRRMADRNRSSSDLSDRVAAEDEIDRLYVSLADASPAQQVYINRALDRKEREYERKYGKKYGGAIDIPTGKQDSANVTTFDGYDSVLEQELKANGNNGRLSNSQIAKLQSILDKLPSGDKHNARQKDLDAIKSNEKHDSDVQAQKAKENAALDEITRKVTGFGLKKGESKTVAATNGKSVTVTRLPGGNVQYKCGSTTR